MNNIYKHILILITSLICINCYSQESINDNRIPISISHYYYKIWGRNKYFDTLGIKLDSLKKVTEVAFLKYWGDSLLILPTDFPNLQTINITTLYDMNCNGFDLKGISKFKNLKKIEISFNDDGYLPGLNIDCNINEIYNCTNIEKINIYTKYPIELSDSIIKLQKLKEFYMRVINPEILTKLPNWQNFNYNLCDFVICCKIKNISYENFLQLLESKRLNIDGDINYNFQLDSIFTIYYKNNIIACQGSYKNNKRIGTWKYYDENGRLLKRYEYSNQNKLLEMEIVEYESKNSIRNKEINTFSPRNNETNFKCSSIFINYENRPEIDTFYMTTVYNIDTTNRMIYLIDYKKDKYFFNLQKTEIYKFKECNNEIEKIECLDGYGGGNFHYDKKECYSCFCENRYCNCEDSFFIPIIKLIHEHCNKFEELENYFKEEINENQFNIK